jgi:hypothetical protein
VTFPPVEQIPGPPPGPGVRAPFAAPPSERDRKRMWIGLTLGAVLLVVCCGGGIVAFIGLVVAQNRAIPAEASAVVDRYLTALRDEHYQDAYDLLCGDARNTYHYDFYVQRVRSQPPVRDWTIERVLVAGAEVRVDVELDPSGAWSYTLVEDQQAGGLRICAGE